VLSQLAHKALIIQDMKNAVAAGKIVTISKSTISYKGWTGAGYSIVDPNTGAGAYLIGGGADGGYFLGAINGFGAAALLGGFVFGAGFPLMIVLAVFLIASLIASIVALANADSDSQLCFNQGINVGFGIYGIVFVGANHLISVKNITIITTVTREKSLILALLNVVFPVAIGQVSQTNTAQDCIGK
jgi:hypothetical protein